MKEDARTPWAMIDEKTVDKSYELYKTGKINISLAPDLQSLFRVIQFRDDLKNKLNAIRRNYPVHVVNERNTGSIGVLVKEDDFPYGKYTYLTIQNSVFGSSITWTIGHLRKDGHTKTLGSGQTTMTGLEITILAASIMAVFDITEPNASRTQ